MDIQHVVGKANPVAEGGCHGWVWMSWGIFFSMAATQPGDQEIIALKTTGTGLKLENAVEQEVGPMPLGDVSTGRARPIELVTGIGETGWVQVTQVWSL